MPQVALASVQRVERLASALSIDGTLERSWTLDGLLAASARTTVYAAAHVRDGRRAAIKVLRGREDEERFLREVAHTDAASLIGSPALRGYGTTRERESYLVLDLLGGRTLEQHSVLRGGRFDLATALLIAERLLSVVAKLHKLGVVHRDIQPANVFITQFGDVRLLDYSEATRARVLLARDAWRGVAGFAPPEQRRGAEEQADPRVDVYAVGAVLFWMLTGSAEAVARWGRGESDGEPLAAISHLPPDVTGFLELALAPETQCRIASAMVMGGVLSGMRTAFSGLDWARESP